MHSIHTFIHIHGDSHTERKINILEDDSISHIHSHIDMILRIKYMFI